MAKVDTKKKVKAPKVTKATKFDTEVGDKYGEAQKERFTGDKSD